MAKRHYALPPGSKSILDRVKPYKCSTGFRTANHQIHHILCVESVGRRKIHYKGNVEKLAYIKACLDLTKYDINNANNLIGLPTNTQYRKSKGQVPVNFVSHSCDHNTDEGYRDEVADWLVVNVWDSLEAKKNGHDVDPKNIAQQMKEAEKKFRERLESRALRPAPKPGLVGGTLSCWNNRFKPAYTKVWYQPFSMAKTTKVSPRNPGKPNSKSVEEVLKKL
jgi:hypothetical protein